MVLSSASLIAVFPGAIFFNGPRQRVGVVQARGLVEGNSLRRSSLPWNSESGSQLTGIGVWIRFNRTELSHRSSTVRHYDDVALTRARDESAQVTLQQTDSHPRHRLPSMWSHYSTSVVHEIRLAYQGRHQAGLLVQSPMGPGMRRAGHSVPPWPRTATP